MNKNLPPLNQVSQSMIDVITSELISGLDISALHKEFNKRLESDRVWTSKLSDNLPVVFFIVNRQEKVVWWNRRLEVLTGLSMSEHPNTPIHKFFPPSESSVIQLIIGKAFSEGSAEVKSRLLAKNLQRIPLHLKANRTEIQGKPYLLGLGLEVAASEQMLQESEQNRMLLMAIANQSDTVIFVKDNEGKYFMINPKFKEVMGRKDHEIIGKNDFDLFESGHASVLRQDDLEVIEQQKPKKFEEKVDTPSGQRYYLTSKFPLLGIPGLEQGICGIATEITRFKEKELRVRKQQKAITYLATDVLLSEATLDAKLSTITRKSAETLKVGRVNVWLLEDDLLHCISSYDSEVNTTTKGEVLNMNKYPAYKNEVKINREMVINDARNDYRSRDLFEDYLKPNDIYSLLDTSIHISKTVTLLVCHEAVGEKRMWKQDEISFVGAIADQVAQALAKEEREAREREVRESLKEKEILLSEIHHRVKNNLAVVSSLLQLQAFEETNEEVKIKLRDSVIRIQTMATIHEQLYQSKSFSNMDFSENIRKLITNIIDTHQLSIPIETDFRLQPIHLNVNQAIPCSLIINEVVTNALKHAFAGKKAGNIVCTMSQDNSEIKLIINDNGVGLPENFDVSRQKSLGLVLIDVLARQLDARYEFASDDEGCEFRLVFEKSKDKKGISGAHIG